LTRFASSHSPEVKMRSALIIIAVLVVLLGGTFLGITALLLLPFAGGILLVAALIWVLQRRARGKRPIP
jgi:hypothetical protein